jgi:hypothetical protein
MIPIYPKTQSIFTAMNVNHAPQMLSPEIKEFYFKHIDEFGARYEEM